MFTEAKLHKHPVLPHSFTGISAEEFWDMIEKTRNIF